MTFGLDGGSQCPSSEQTGWGSRRKLRKQSRRTARGPRETHCTNIQGGSNRVRAETGQNISMFDSGPLIRHYCTGCAIGSIIGNRGTGFNAELGNAMLQQLRRSTIEVNFFTMCKATCGMGSVFARALAALVSCMVPSPSYDPVNQNLCQGYWNTSRTNASDRRDGLCS